jgi:MFS family permease
MRSEAWLERHALFEFRHGSLPLLGAFLGTGLGVGSIYLYSMGIFIKPLQAEFGWSRGSVSIGTVIAPLVIACVVPFIGRLVDRIGARWIAGLSLVGLSIGFFLLSGTTASLPRFLALVALTCLLGAGSSAVVFTRVVTSWFVKKRGTALGIQMASIGVAGAVAPLILAPFVADYGWRSGYQALAAVALIGAPVVMLLLGRTRTSDEHGANLATDQPLPAELAQAAGREVMWLLGSTFFLAALAMGSVIVHFIPMLTDAGVPSSRAGAIAGAIGFAIIVGRLGVGMLIDYVFAPYVAATLLSFAGVGCFLLSVQGPLLALPAALLIGLAMGGEVDILGYLVARYFGSQRFGWIFGWQFAAFLVGSAIGPVAAGAAYDRFGDYRIALTVAGASLLLAALLALRLPKFPTPFSKTVS